MVQSSYMKLSSFEVLEIEAGLDMGRPNAQFGFRVYWGLERRWSIIILISKKVLKVSIKGPFAKSPQIEAKSNIFYSKLLLQLR